ncbi:MAG: ComF family protein [Betaproteobacteria bacterium]|nr:ComF family protein [Betaproteobacteria bacterium]
MTLRPSTSPAESSREGFSFQSQDCQLCGAWADAVLCGACRIALPYRCGRRCPVCDIAANEDLPCGACLADPPHFDATVSAFAYAFPLDRLMQSYKFRANLTMVEVFADALAGRLRLLGAQSPDCIVPMPLGRKRLAERGFNQAALLAAALGKSLGIPVRLQDLLRVRDTAPQSGLSRDARLKNVRGAFSGSQSVAGMHIALVDDVMTTGATLSEAARALKKAGAARVEAWVVARVMTGAASESSIQNPDI